MPLLQRSFNNRQALEQYLKETFPYACDVDRQMSSSRGGRAAALEILHSFTASRYGATRNFLDGKVSRLSAYIRHGVVSLQEVREHALEKTPEVRRIYKFIQELAWRDYWRKLYEQLGDDVWVDQEAWKTGYSAADYADDLPQEIEVAETGLACMDAFASELAKTGYLHNHARMWLAAYVIHWRRVKWQAGARWFLRHLLDGDPASNSLSWQWVASTFSSKPHFFNRENLENYTHGVYCAKCPARGKCPFEGTYQELSARLFQL